MKKKEIMAFWQGLTEISKQGDHPRQFAYAIARNMGKLRDIVAALEDACKPIDVFEKQRVALAEAMSKKDADGNPVSLPNNQGVVIANMLAFNKALEDLRETTGQAERDKEIEEMMSTEERVDVYMVPYKLVPEMVRPDILEALMPMIEEPIN